MTIPPFPDDAFAVQLVGTPFSFHLKLPMPTDPPYWLRQAVTITLPAVFSASVTDGLIHDEIPESHW